ncbi:thermopsin family protease [Thermoproteus tenax]|uniref:Thermopsin n=1 Tax=Thermoproteus tenax (strain ATCC 35583 / DSM 2078 / JCM 9277 / NBRC 100435 / Kra 1) TaxID=768679 RepID=G4RQ63_THETK|nr:thermopsin family protease [Thermoproteus tenax]CCC80700.1 Thermopsin [Thermoproteus tenax Kra 1]
MKRALALAMLLAAFIAAQPLQAPTQGYYYNVTVAHAPAYIVFVSNQLLNYSVWWMTYSNCQRLLSTGFAPSLGIYTIPRLGLLPLVINQPGQYCYVLEVPCRYEAEAHPVTILLSEHYYGLPTGIVSYPQSPVETNAVAGFFNITDISAASYATLQLSVIVQADLVGGGVQYYWAREMLVFSPNGQLKFENYVANSSSPGSSMQSVSGRGHLSLSRYLYSSEWSPYSLPISGFLLITAEAAKGVVLISFGYVLIQNGSLEPVRIVWIDNVTIRTSQPASSASIAATITYSSSGFNALDAELVFGGYNGSVVSFKSVSAELGLFYWDGAGWTAFPNLYNFGVNVPEAASNLAVQYYGGLAHVGVGALSPSSLTTSPTTPPLPTTSVEYINATSGSTHISYIMGDGWFLNRMVVFYPVSITSPIPIYVNGTETTSYSAYLPAGAALVIQDGYARYSNGTMFVPSVGNETIVVEGALNIAVSWTPYYLVEVYSPLPVFVNGTAATRYAQYVRAGSALALGAPQRVVFDNGTMFVPAVGNETVVVSAPARLAVSWTPYYLVRVSSPIPVEVNGTESENYTEWVKAASLLVVTARAFILDNGTMFTPGFNGTLRVMSPLNLSIVWTPWYKVDVHSEYPIEVDGASVLNFSRYLRAGSVVTISARPVPLYGGLVWLDPNVTSLSTSVRRPLQINVGYTPDYTVAISVVVLVLSAALSAGLGVYYVKRRSQRLYLEGGL